ncbi:FMN-dependent NADH-azoreductase [Desulfotalea psychrophila]|uniref:FMN-dependent NADH:quinone oxidoreductase n=1 Tax=Desulfotalea psychrophila (strain LSv54 / DSM 12343) TaxID=177439 RepID=AZOR_DESPS|nr:NAD(P)H-dependent oxidoreductase [Desulfotalea psychrophila]Q6ALS1.1 RecName: Full=FMN-dependent NADH:quinone oxidoreductase; AltName: Full=Azo-dye reductase; AltName: Full=FMN-dependent NADH-azo compound oxidoreductase; AltName: Full=FMN-dependent NADH-azoreductase [Desulfotalea psychrophila LSv54]CAG36704.1 related to acyl carrier protein phosphodiesterase [Desulfotalea psychrophila LSv54]
MSKLLYIEASPRKNKSFSTRVAQSFINTFLDADPANRIETLDLWDFPLPEVDGSYLSAKYKILHWQDPTEAEARAWTEIANIVSQFKDADSYLFSIPMWNFSIPYKLKHFIDIITQPGLTFMFSPESGYQGLVTGKACTVIYARGAQYRGTKGSTLDFQKTYMELLLSFIGFENIHSIRVEPTLTDSASRERVLATAKLEAISLAKELYSLI